MSEEKAAGTSPPDRFYLEHLDQVDLIGADGEPIKLDQALTQNGGSSKSSSGKSSGGEAAFDRRGGR